jgi:3-oxoacyl-[acyl-carrier protein] reductase
MSVNYEIENRVAIITGASSGIGFAAAKGLALQGVNLILVSRNEDKLKHAQKEIQALSSSNKVEIFPGDVIDKKLAQKVVDLAVNKWGKVDILINNAGGPPMGSFLDHNNDVWEAALDQNLKSVIRFTQAVSHIMIKNNWGRIINITSTLAKEPTPLMVLSATARAGVSAFAKSISSELAQFGVTVNTLCPGGVLTERLHSLLMTASAKQEKSYEDVLESSQATIPLGRFAEPDEFADMLVFMASERARYITGTTVMVDGGLTKGIF